MVAVALLAVAMAAVFGTDDVRFLKRRADGGCRVSGSHVERRGRMLYREDEGREAALNQEQREGEETDVQKSAPH